MEKGIMNRVLQFGVMPLIIGFVFYIAMLLVVFSVGYGFYWLYVRMMN
jgi:hypothetical protein